MSPSMPPASPDSQRLGLRRILARAALVLLAVGATLGCALWDLAGEEIYGAAFEETATEEAIRLDELFRRQTSQAKDLARMLTQIEAESKTREARTPTPSLPPSPPVIDRVEFPAHILGNGATYYGEMDFRDPNGDVNRITIDVVQAEDFGSADYDPSRYIVSGDYYQGVIQLYIWCQGQQKVTLRTTLYDRSGLRSNSVDFGFTCE